MLHSIKMSSIQLNKAFQVLSSLFADINKKKLFWSKMYFSQQNEPHIAELNISGVLKHFCGF